MSLKDELHCRYKKHLNIRVSVLNIQYHYHLNTSHLVQAAQNHSQMQHQICPETHKNNETHKNMCERFLYENLFNLYFDHLTSV